MLFLLDDALDLFSSHLCRLAIEKEEYQVLYNNAARDLKRVDAHINLLHDSLMASERKTLLAEEKLASADATITGLTIPFQFDRLNIF